MSEPCVRSITFTIPDPLDGAGVQVTVIEQDGKLIFTVEVLETSNKSADLRGLFFHIDESVLPGLAVTNADPIITDTQIALNSVLNLGNGVNMNGAVTSGFDVGIKFGTPGVGHDDVNGPVSFTLEGTGDLTLDDIAHMQFGARTTSSGSKLTTIAPAAPDAVADAYDIFEDGQSGLDDPSTVPQGVLFDVLANDTDADGDTLTVTDVFGALHGTVQIVDGDDADLLPGDAVLYTPVGDYAGADAFTYCISDNNGGTDFADVAVAVTAVADVPDLDVQVLAGNAVNEIRLIVTATQTDADSSEFIDRILTSALPDGVTLVPASLNPGDEPDQILEEYLLTLPLDQDADFDLTFTAVSKETSNGDEETATRTVHIDYEYNLNQYNPNFLATDQSIWDSGDQFVFTDNRFIGIDRGVDDDASAFFFYDIDAHVKAGFQSKLTFEGGEVDAHLNYNLDVETNFNKTTDSLLITSNSILSGGSFTTEGPEGSYKLDFIFNYSIDASAGIDIGIDKWEVVDVDIARNRTINLIDETSDNLSVQIPLPFGLSATLAWPNVDTTGASSAPPPGEFFSNGASNNFLQLNLDVDDALADIFLGGVNPFDLEFDLGVVWGDVELVDLDLFGGLNFLQSFVMQEQGLPGTLHFEDETDLAFTFGSDILLQNASAIDLAGDGDGNVEFILTLDPQASLRNNTDLGFNVGYSFDLLKVSGGYDVVVDSGSFNEGPAFHAGGTLPLGSVDVYDTTFALNFADQDVNFFA